VRNLRRLLPIDPPLIGIGDESLGL
jgi:hypothetical protein